MCIFCLCICCLSSIIVVVVVVIVVDPPPVALPLPLVLIVFVCLGNMSLANVLDKALAPLHQRGVAEPELLLGGIGGMCACATDIDRMLLAALASASSLNSMIILLPCGLQQIVLLTIDTAAAAVSTTPPTS